MDVKIDTKEKFTVLTPTGGEIPANMTVELVNLLLSYMEKDIPHVILNLKSLTRMDVDLAKQVADVQQKFYDNNHSFVICEMQPELENFFDTNNLLETMNVTPTESEAWDIVQMEEIERELLGDFDEEE